MEQAKVVIVGSGPAGYTAALYTARADLNPIVYEGFFSGPAGGQLMTTTDVENYPGFPDGVSGPEMMDCFRRQAARFDTRFLVEDVERADLTPGNLVVHGSKTSIQAEVVIIATGATAKRLDVPGTRDGEYWQKGVAICAVCDGAMPIFRGQELFVIGGGDTACEEAVFLTKYASKVNIVHRRDELRASRIMAERVINHPKVEVFWDSVLVGVDGDEVVRSVTLQNVKTKEETTHPAGGVFFSIGHTPNTAFLKGQIDLHENGYVKVKSGTCETSVEGVFAAGDVQDQVYRQAVTAAGSGCMAALEAERWLEAQELD